MAIQSILGLAPAAPAASKGSLAEPEGGFEQALALAVGEPPPTAPPLASPPGSVSGDEKEGVLPTLPNATGTQLDFFLPNQPGTATQPDMMLASLAAVGLVPTPILVSPALQEVAATPNGQAPATASKLGATSEAGMSFALPIVAMGASPSTIATIESQPVVSDPQGRVSDVNAGQAAQTFVGLDSQPLVELSGMTKQNAGPVQALDAQMLNDLGLESISQTEVWTKPSVTLNGAPVATEDGTVPAPVALTSPAAPTADQNVATDQLSDPAVVAASSAPKPSSPTEAGSPMTAQAVAASGISPAPKAHTEPTTTGTNVSDADAEVEASNSVELDLPANQTVQQVKPQTASAETAGHGLMALVEEADPTSKTDATLATEFEGEPALGMQMPQANQTAATEKVAVKAEMPADVQREALKQTIERIEQMALHRPMTQMVIRLMPEELGSVLITVKTLGMKSEADITVSNERLAVALESARPQLIQAVESKGVSLSQLTLQMGGEQAGQSHDQPQRDDFQRAQQFFQSMRPETAATTTSANPSWGARATTLDLVI